MSISNVTIFKNGKTSVFAPKTNVLLGKLKHQFEVNGKSRPEQNRNKIDVWGLPEVWKARNSERIYLTQPIQEYIFGMFLRVAWSNGMPDNDATTEWAKNQWRVATRHNAFWTNNSGNDNGLADYINGTNLNSKPMQAETIMTGGAALEILDNAKIYKIRLIDCYKFKTLNAYGNMPDLKDFDPYIQTTQTFFATTSTRDVLSDGTLKVMPLGPLGSMNCPFPILGNGEYNFIDKNLVELLPVGSPIPNPYNME